MGSEIRLICIVCVFNRFVSSSFSRDSIQKEIDDVKGGLFKMNQKKEAPKPVVKKVSALEEQRSQYVTNKGKLKQKGREDEVGGIPLLILIKCSRKVSHQ